MNTKQLLLSGLVTIISTLHAGPFITMVHNNTDTAYVLDDNRPHTGAGWCPLYDRERINLPPKSIININFDLSSNIVPIILGTDTTPHYGLHKKSEGVALIPSNPKEETINFKTDIKTFYKLAIQKDIKKTTLEPVFHIARIENKQTSEITIETLNPTIILSESCVRPAFLKRNKYIPESRIELRKFKIGTSKLSKTSVSAKSTRELNSDEGHLTIGIARLGTSAISINEHNQLVIDNKIFANLKPGNITLVVNQDGSIDAKEYIN